MRLNHIYCMDNVEGLRKYIPDESIDLTITSPPYDNLRKYNNYSWDFESLAHELYRVTKPGGVVVWIVGDATINGSETLTSFKQAIYFKEVVGFKMHDTMIYGKRNWIPLTHNRYEQQFEYMFILTKGKIKTFNPLTMPTKNPGEKKIRGQNNRGENKSYRERKHERITPKEKRRPNIWFYDVGRNLSTKDNEAFEHPAIFPEKLAEDHILSWSNPNDIVLDPFMGSGTTAKMALLNNRYYIGFEINIEYCRIAEERIKKIKKESDT